MSSPARSTPADTGAAHRIGTLDVEIDVANPASPIGSPEALTAGVKSELLAAVAAALERAEAEGISARIESLDVDLGTIGSARDGTPDWTTARDRLTASLLRRIRAAAHPSGQGEAAGKESGGAHQPGPAATHPRPARTLAALASLAGTATVPAGEMSGQALVRIARTVLTATGVTERQGAGVLDALRTEPEARARLVDLLRRWVTGAARPSPGDAGGGGDDGALNDLGAALAGDTAARDRLIGLATAQPREARHRAPHDARAGNSSAANSGTAISVHDSDAPHRTGRAGAGAGADEERMSRRAGDTGSAGGNRWTLPRDAGGARGIHGSQAHANPGAPASPEDQRADSPQPRTATPAADRTLAAVIGALISNPSALDAVLQALPARNLEAVALAALGETIPDPAAEDAELLPEGAAAAATRAAVRAALEGVRAERRMPEDADEAPGRDQGPRTDPDTVRAAFELCADALAATAASAQPVVDAIAGQRLRIGQAPTPAALETAVHEIVRTVSHYPAKGRAVVFHAAISRLPSRAVGAPLADAALRQAAARLETATPGARFAEPPVPPSAGLDTLGSAHGSAAGPPDDAAKHVRVPDPSGHRTRRDAGQQRAASDYPGLDGAGPPRATARTTADEATARHPRSDRRAGGRSDGDPVPAPLRDARRIGTSRPSDTAPLGVAETTDDPAARADGRNGAIPAFGQEQLRAGSHDPAIAQAGQASDGGSRAEESGSRRRPDDHIAPPAAPASPPRSGREDREVAEGGLRAAFHALLSASNEHGAVAAVLAALPTEALATVLREAIGPAAADPAGPMGALLAGIGNAPDPRAGYGALIKDLLAGRPLDAEGARLSAGESETIIHEDHGRTPSGFGSDPVPDVRTKNAPRGTSGSSRETEKAGGGSENPVHAPRAASQAATDSTTATAGARARVNPAEEPEGPRAGRSADRRIGRADPVPEGMGDIVEPAASDAAAADRDAGSRASDPGSDLLRSLAPDGAAQDAGDKPRDAAIKPSRYSSAGRAKREMSHSGVHDASVGADSGSPEAAAIPTGTEGQQRTPPTAPDEGDTLPRGASGTPGRTAPADASEDAGTVSTSAALGDIGCTTDRRKQDSRGSAGHPAPPRSPELDRPFAADRPVRADGREPAEHSAPPGALDRSAPPEAVDGPGSASSPAAWHGKRQLSAMNAAGRASELSTPARETGGSPVDPSVPEPIARLRKALRAALSRAATDAPEALADAVTTLPPETLADVLRGAIGPEAATSSRPIGSVLAEMAALPDPGAGYRALLGDLIAGRPLDAEAARDAAHLGEAPSGARLLPTMEALDAFAAALPAPEDRRALIAGTITASREDLARAQGADLPALAVALGAVIAALGPADAPDSLRRLRVAAARLRGPTAGTGAARAAQKLADTALRLAVPAIDDTDAAEHMAISTEAAGLVLFHPYLSRLFDRAGCLAPDRSIADLPRARALLHALAGGAAREGATDPIQTVLLGTPFLQSLPEASVLPPAVLAMIEDLSRALIGAWGALGTTTPEGLRDAFVRREGMLRMREDGATAMTVAHGPFDVLLDRLPFTIATVRLPWMTAPLHVRWRNRDDG